MHQRIVVKVGSSSLTTPSGELDSDQIRYFAAELARVKNEGHTVLLVTSGSVAAGFGQIGYERRPKLLHEKQAAAAVGQALLMQAYAEAFLLHGCKVAQVLLTRSDFSDRRRAHNAMMTIEELLRSGIVPIINENDTVAVDELTFGDNDTLSALVANLVKANQLIILTDTDGLYSEDPRKNPHARRFDRIESIDDNIMRIAGEAGSAVGTGGMRSKMEAAKIAVRGGIPVFVGTARDDGDVLRAVMEEGKGTYFASRERKLPMKKQWVGFHSLPRGRIVIDQGAREALINAGKSLLPAGVLRTEGHFLPGDVVEVFDENEQLIGKGIVNYSAKQLQESAGLDTAIAMQKVGVQRAEVIHRDEWMSLYP